MEHAISPYKAVALKLTSLGWLERIFMLTKLDKEQRKQVWQQLKPLRHLTQSEAADLYQDLIESSDKQNKPLSLVAKLPVEQRPQAIFSDPIEDLVDQARTGQTRLAPKLAEALLQEYDRIAAQGVDNG